MDRISEEETPLSTIDYTYDANGRRASMTVAGEPAVNYAYDDAGRLTGISRNVGGFPRTYALGYDNGGRRASVQIPLATGGDFVTTVYGYDIANRITSMLLQGPTAQIENLTYTYDPNGNRLSFMRNAPQTVSPAVSNTNYDEANEMLAFNSKTLTYDANGNLLTKTDVCGTTTYTWDARNRLTGISGYKPDCSCLTASFSYDAKNRRISKTIDGTTTQYVYDGWDIIQEIAAGAKTNYVRTLSIDEPLTRIDGTTTRHYVRDALGSVVRLADDSGASETTYVYDAFGTSTATGETSTNPFQFTGRENDGTGLYHYRYRYYSPEMQRFISEDPIRLSGGLNYFSYVQNNPINFTDPLGLRCKSLKENFDDNRKMTNDVFFGDHIKTAIGFATSGSVARTVGTVTPLQVLINVARTGSLSIANMTTFGTLASAEVNMLVNGALVAGSLEAGIVVGSGIDALIQTNFQQDDCDCK